MCVRSVELSSTREPSWVHPFTAGRERLLQRQDLNYSDVKTKRDPCLESKHQNAYSKSRAWICQALSREMPSL